MQQKVRFDKTTALPDSDNATDGENIRKGNVATELRESHTENDWDRSEHHGDQPERDDVNRLEPVTSTPRTSPHSSSRAPRRSPRIRLVDAFGKEITTTSEVTSQNGQDTASSQHDVDAGRKDSSLGRKGMLRIVDAMGREVQENSTDSPDKVANDSADPAPADEVDGCTQKQARELIQQTLAELKDDFAHMDR